MQRIIIKDKDEKAFRICSFGFYNDVKDEDYIKFSFPDLKNVKTSTDSSTSEDDYIMEFSTHFKAGVSHFKTSDQKRVHRNESESKFADSDLIHLLTYTLYDLNHFKKFTKKSSPGDYEIQNIFESNKGKVFEFYLSRLTKEIKIPAKNYDDLTWKQYHPFESKAKNYRMIMVEYDFNELDPTMTGVSLFRKYDQKEGHVAVTLPEV